MKKTRILFPLVMIIASSSAIAQSKGEMPFTSSSANANKVLRNAWAALADSRIEEANQYTRQLLQEDPECAMAYASLFTEDSKEAEKNLQLAETMKLSEDERLFLTAVKAKRENRPNQPYLEPLIKKYPSDYYLQLWSMYLNSEPDQAIKTGETLIRKKPKFAPAYNILGYLYMGKNDMTKAETSFNKYIDLRPDLANPYDSKGDYLMHAGKIQEAIPLYEKAASMGMSPSMSKAESAKLQLKFPKPSTEDAKAMEQMLLAATAATKNGDVDALLKDYSEHAVEIHGNQIANVGLPNVRKRVTNMFKNGSFPKQELSMQAFHGAGPIAIAYGRNESIWKQASTGEESEWNGSGIFLFRKQKDGAWKILADHFYESDSKTFTMDDRQSIQQLLKDWTTAIHTDKPLTAEDLDAFEKLYSKQAIEIFSGGVSNIGIANLRQRWEQFVGATFSMKSLGTLGIEGEGRRAIAWGIARQTFQGKDGQEAKTSEFPWAGIFTKEKDDVWRVLTLHWGAD